MAKRTPKIIGEVGDKQIEARLIADAKKRGKDWTPKGKRIG